MHENNSVRRRAVAGFGLAAVAVIAVAGCSPDEERAGNTAGALQSVASVSPSESPASKHNEADVEFTSTMVGHHRQAVMMSGLVEGRTDNAELIALASSIERAQNTEITEMENRLESWGVDSHDMGDMGVGHGGHDDMPGMLSADQMTALRNSKGAAFDRLWLEGMIRHHEGAIAMADAILADGVDPATKALAAEVKKAQQAEIEQMNGMLGRS